MLKRKFDCKKGVLAALAAITILAGGFMAFAKEKENDIVSLGSQKSGIEDSLAMESISTIEDFQAECWVSNRKILGVHGQAHEKDYGGHAQICLYDIESNEFETIERGIIGEEMFIGRVLEDGRFFYSELIDGDLSENYYRYNLYDMDKKESIQLSDHMSDVSYDEKNRRLFIAEGFKTYLSDLDGKRREIGLPKELLRDLNDFSRFTFEDYKEAYYSGETLEGERLALIKKNYEKSVEKNRIEWSRWISDEEVFLSSNNREEFVYNLKTGEYRAAKAEEHAKVFPKHEFFRGPLRRFFGDIEKGQPEVSLCRVDESGEQIDTIDTGKIYKLEFSPDKKKASYVKELNDKKIHAYIYDMEKQKGIEIFSELAWTAHWNEDSRQFFMTGKKKDSSGKMRPVTSVIRLSN